MRVALVALLLLAGCTGSESGVASQPTRAGNAGVSVELPSGWHSLTPLRDTHVIDPVARVVVSSAQIEEGGTSCQVADFAPPPDAVSIVILEWRRSDGRPPPPRPAHFTGETLRLSAPPAIECFNGSGGAAFFAERGRVFGAYLLLGKQAPADLADRARAVLDTLQVGS